MRGDLAVFALLDDAGEERDALFLWQRGKEVFKVGFDARDRLNAGVGVILERKRLHANATARVGGHASASEALQQGRVSDRKQPRRGIGTGGATIVEVIRVLERRCEDLCREIGRQLRIPRACAEVRQQRALVTLVELSERRRIDPARVQQRSVRGAIVGSHILHIRDSPNCDRPARPASAIASTLTNQLRKPRSKLLDYLGAGIQPVGASCRFDSGKQQPEPSRHTRPDPRESGNVAVSVIPTWAGAATP